MWQQFGEGPFLFQHDNAPVHKAKSIQKWFVEIGVEELDWPSPNRALTSTPSNTFGMNWNADCEPDLITQHQCLTSLMLVAEWKQVPAAMFQHVVENLPRRVEAVVAAKGGPT